MKFKEFLEELMYDKNLDIEQLSNRLNIDESTIYKYFNQGHLPNLDVLIKISNFFKCSINCLVDANSPNNYSEKYVSNFYAVYLALLKKNKVSNYKVCTTLGISRNRKYDWKKGVVPNIHTLITLANYFNVSVDYLIGKEF